MPPPPPKDLFIQRKPASQVTEADEDQGLFGTGLRQVMVELIPQIRRTTRGDVVIRGFVDRKFEIDVVIAGRRVREVAPLEKRLKALLRAARAMASAAQNEAPEVETLRLPVRMEGAWRKQVARDTSGWETSSHHFVVARWSMLDQNGNTISYGPAAVLPQKSLNL